MFKNSSPTVQSFYLHDKPLLSTFYFSEEGLFRVSGNRRLIELLRTEYDQSGTADLSSVQDVSVVTSVFKMFFRELPEPLIPDAVSPDLCGYKTAFDHVTMNN